VNVGGVELAPHGPDELAGSAAGDKPAVPYAGRPPIQVDEALSSVVRME